MSKNDTLIQFGGAVKTLGDGKFKAPLVLFTGAEAKDLANDFFNENTDYFTTFPVERPLLFQHGLDPVLGKKRLGLTTECKGLATLTLQLEDNEDNDEYGVWMQGQLDLADKYEAFLYKMAEQKKLGTSSGSATHLVEREKQDGAFYVKSWPIVEASLTLEPCQPLNRGVVPVKSRPGIKTLTEWMQAEGEEVHDLKSARLGNLAPDVIGAAFDRLTSRLSRFVNQQVYGNRYGWYDIDDTPDQADKVIDRDAIAEALQEYENAVLTVLDAMIGRKDLTTAEVKTFLTQFEREPLTSAPEILAAMPFKTYLETMGTVVSEFDRRMTWYDEQRSLKQGRPISEANLTAMREVHDGMSENLGKLNSIIARHSNKQETKQADTDALDAETQQWLKEALARHDISIVDNARMLDELELLGRQYAG